LAAAFRAHEQIIFSAESHTAHGSLRRIIVRLQEAVVEIGPQSIRMANKGARKAVGH
jgi:hypothetical protein